MRITEILKPKCTMNCATQIPRGHLTCCGVWTEVDVRAQAKQAKLREMIEMLPDIMGAITGYGIIQDADGIEDPILTPDVLEELHNKLEKWRDE